MITLKKSDFQNGKVYLALDWISNSHWSVRRAKVKNAHLFPTADTGPNSLLALGLPVEWISPERMKQIEESAFNPAGEIYKRSKLTASEAIVFTSTTGKILFFEQAACDYFGIQEVKSTGPAHPASAEQLIIMPCSFSHLPHQEKVELWQTAARLQEEILPEAKPAMHRPGANPQPEGGRIMTTPTDKNSTPLYAIVAQINDDLRSLGKVAVQEIKMEKDGKVIGQVKYGYRPQYVVDAVNRHLGPENWKYEVLREELTDTQALAEVKLYVKINDEWLAKGSHVGQMQIVKQNKGDAEKGAITSALQKCFATLSIGSDAYLGLLKAVYQGSPSATGEKSSPDLPPPTAPETDSLPQGDETPTPEETPAPSEFADLPQIKGVSYARENGTIVAVGNNLYYKRDKLKAAGFRWDTNTRLWKRPVTPAEAEATH